MKSIVSSIRTAVKGISGNGNRLFLSSSRVPSIKFIGKRSLLAASPTTVADNHPVKHNDGASEGKGIYFGSLEGAAFYGRPHISDIEAEAIESGGAELVP